MEKLAFKLLFVAALLGMFFTWHYTDKNHAVATATANVEAIYKGQLKAAHDENSLLKQFRQKDEKQNEEIKTVNRKLDLALSELRNRPYRPNPEVPATGNSEACTGTQLYREDAEFLTREAARAETIRIERDSLYEKYEAARKVINGTK